MRILVVTQHLGVVGGVETYLKALLPQLIELGHEIALITAHDGGHERITDRCPEIPLWVATESVLDPVRNWAPEVVFSHGMASPEFERDLASLYPTVYFSHNYGGTCISGAKCHSFPTVTPCQRSFGIGCLVRYLPLRCGGLNPVTALRLYKRERRRLNSFQDYRTICVASHHMSAELIANGVPRQKVHIVPYPIDTLSDTNPPVIRSFSNRLLFASRMTSVKGWSQLVAALPLAVKAIVRSIQLVVAGDGPDRARFESCVRNAGISTTFLGWIGKEQRMSEMRQADLLVVPSVWPEPFGLVGPEAGCVGLPAVAYAVGGICDWLEPGINGELAPGDPPEPQPLAEAIIRALTDHEHWLNLRLGAWKMSQRYNMKRHLDQLLPILEQATKP